MGGLVDYCLVGLGGGGHFLCRLTLPVGRIGSSLIRHTKVVALARLQVTSLAFGDFVELSLVLMKAESATDTQTA